MRVGNAGSIIKQTPREVLIDFGERQLTLGFSNGGLTLTATEGNRPIAAWTAKSVGFRTAEGHSYSTGKFDSWTIEGDAISLLFQAGDAQVAGRVKPLSPGTIELHFELVAADSAEWSHVAIEANEDEHFHGFGERFNKLDQRGKVVDLWVRNGASGDETYKPIPFFFSTANYGVYVDTTFRCLCEVCVPHRDDQVSIAVNEGRLRFYLILEKEPLDIISAYTEITGRSSLPPKWAFGPWKSRFAGDQSRHVIYEDADRHRELRVPCSVIVLDGWWDEDPLEPRFRSDRYPDGEQMVAALHKQGFKVIGWIAPWIVRDPENPEDWEKVASLGYFIRNEQGEPYICRLTNGPNTYGSLVDFTNPNAVVWWQNRIRGFIRLGIDGIKTDFGEQVPVDAVFHNGKTGKEMHNVYPRLYNQCTWQVIQEVDGILFARSAWAGSQQFPGVWAGDQTADFCPWTGLGSAVIAGQAVGMSGFPFWTSDIGGYFGAPNKNCFLRWAQFGAFSPWMQIHGNGRHEPWAFDQETLDIYRRFATLHTRLFPYIYSYAREACETGHPIIRALALHFFDDPFIYTHDFCSYQYMFGREFLVAPIIWSDDEKRRIYLPKGRWMDFWSYEELEGGKDMWYGCGHDKIPVFVREGSIIPMLADYADTLAPAVVSSVATATEDLSLLVYAHDSARFAMYDGTTFEYKALNDQHELTIKSAADRRIDVEFCGVHAHERPEVVGTRNDSILERKPHGFVLRNIEVRRDEIVAVKVL